MVVVDPDEGSIMSGKRDGFEALATTNVEQPARSEPLLNRPITGGVEREQRLRGNALNRALAELPLHAPPWPNPGVRRLPSTAASEATG
jgi:hypothetical protein